MGLRLATYEPEGEGKGKCKCACIHDDCERLRLRQWCRHWCVVRWVTSHPVLSNALEQKLLERLCGRVLRYWGSKRCDDDLWEYCLLLHVDPAGDGAGREELGRLDPSLTSIPGIDFEHGECFLQLFHCCADSLSQGAVGWITAILARANGNASLIGDENLRGELHEQMRQWSVRSCKT